MCHAIYDKMYRLVKTITFPMPFCGDNTNDTSITIVMSSFFEYTHIDDIIFLKPFASAGDQTKPMKCSTGTIQREYFMRIHWLV